MKKFINVKKFAKLFLVLGFVSLINNVQFAFAAPNNQAIFDEAVAAEESFRRSVLL